MSKKQLGSVIYYIFTTLLLAVLAGCATSSGGKRIESDANTPAVPVIEKRYSHIYVCEIETTPALRNDYADALQKCQSTLINSLRQRNKYEKVEAAKNDDNYKNSALIVKLKISDMRIASFAARFWGGAFVGSSYMHIHMTLMDAETQNVAREEDFNSSNNVWAAAYSWGATDRNMPNDMAEIMAEYVVKAVQQN